jgi:hypothetical protein
MIVEGVHPRHVQLHPPEIRRPREIPRRVPGVEHVHAGVVRRRGIRGPHAERGRDRAHAVELRLAERHRDEDVHHGGDRERKPAVYPGAAPCVPVNTAYSDWLAAMKRRLRLGPPKHTLPQISGSRIRPMS